MKTKKGLALVIANADYLQQNKLPTCKKDGNDMQKVLEYLNFDVISGSDLKRTSMYDLISKFLETAELYSTILVYYTGHGVQIDGENYFVPIDCEYMDYEVTRADIRILKQIHSLGDEQYKRLMAYMKALQKLEQMESIVED